MEDNDSEDLRESQIRAAWFVLMISLGLFVILSAMQWSSEYPIDNSLKITLTILGLGILFSLLTFWSPKTGSILLGGYSAFLVLGLASLSVKGLFLNQGRNPIPFLVIPFAFFVILMFLRKSLRQKTTDEI